MAAQHVNGDIFMHGRCIKDGEAVEADKDVVYATRICVEKKAAWQVA